MAPRKKEAPVDSARIEESPLLASRPTLRSSTVDPAKLDRTRFTEIREMESDGSSLRIIIFIAVIIVVGVAAALFVRNAVMNSQNTTTDDTSNTTNTTQQDSTITALTVSKTPLADSSAVNVVKNEDYVDSAIVNLGDSTATSAQTSLDKITYIRYTTFARLTFDLNTSDKKLPKTTVNFDSVGNKMTVVVENLGTVAQSLQQDLPIGDIVDEIRFVETNNSFVIMFKDTVKYNVKKEGDNLVFNFKTSTELAKPDTSTAQQPEEEEEETPAPPTNTGSSTSDANKPVAPHFDNQFSQNKQYVVSNVNTNKLAHNVYYFDNYGSSWEFSWAQRNVIGDSNVPNATAYYDTSTAGKTYLIVEVQNLTQEVLTANGVESLSLSDIEAKTGATTAGSTLVKVELLSFEGGTAKYRLELSKKTDFKLWVDKTVDNQTGTISVTVKN
jgi:hypothetical protein